MTRRKSFNNTTTAFKRWCKNNLSNEYSSECAEYMQIVDGLYVAFSIKEIKEKIIIMSQVATYTNNNFESLSENIDKHEDILKTMLEEYARHIQNITGQSVSTLRLIAC
ncbi:hypothetical protein P4J10_14155 [Bacillus cereus]|uniref:hypothetical protein n=1 Tax=Bacillus thuringiensis TaxID=1428 RepID=UPI000B44B268|nr:hypothetical protein [Bacillus thuringiensis]MEB9467813.1 hypothetical protein [Bacillus cereus]OUA16698.1 hypothetical protein BK776_30620 [Bacillus thuringiensis serovar aizawai]